MKILSESFLWTGVLHRMTNPMKIYHLMVLRLFLMLRQKIGWMSLSIGVAVVIIAFIAADVSYLSPVKIFFDFALAASFLIQTFLAIYFGSSLFDDEKTRRTLHLVLSGGVSRLEWLTGNILGVWVALLLMDLVWSIVTISTGMLQFGFVPFEIFFQIKILQGMECLVLVSLATFFSLWVKPILALALTFSIALFSHSVNEVQKIFMDPITGRFVESSVFTIVYWASKILPPLEWFDIKPLVGYEGSIPWIVALGIAALGTIWSLLLIVASWLRFDRLDI